jgi:hypothetical protein
MKYIAACDWNKDDIEFLIFGYTEDHYITNASIDNKYNCHFIHVYYTIFFNNIMKNKRFDPEDSNSIWTVKYNQIFDTFEQARDYFFTNLFRGY